jgi:hypothetical protein
MVHRGKPPLPPSKLYCRPFNYPEYVKDFDPNAHVRVFKATIKASEIDDANFGNLFNFTLGDIVSN